MVRVLDTSVLDASLRCASAFVFVVWGSGHDKRCSFAFRRATFEFRQQSVYIIPAGNIIILIELWKYKYSVERDLTCRVN